MLFYYLIIHNFS